MDSNSFYKYLSNLLELYKGSIPVVMKKFNAINSDDIELLDKTIQVQQAFLLQTRGFEKKTNDFLEGLGLLGSTLGAVIPQLPLEDQDKFYSLLGEFDYTLKEIQFLNEKCQTLLQAKLYVINSKMSHGEFSSESNFYSKSAKEVEKLKSNSFITRI